MVSLTTLFLITHFRILGRWRLTRWRRGGVTYIIYIPISLIHGGNDYRYFSDVAVTFDVAELSLSLNDFFMCSQTNTVDDKLSAATSVHL